MALSADREAELILRDHHHRGFVITFAVVQVHTRNPRGADCFADINRGVWIPLNYVDLFVVQFAHDSLDADASLAHARPNRINPLLSSRNSHFGTLPRFAGDGTNLNNPVVNFGDFILEQAAQEIAVSPREYNLQPFGHVFDFRHV